MRFLSPALLIGLSAAAVPLIIHLIGRKRAPRYRFAAIEFVFKCNKRMARRLRIRQIVLLAVRMLLAGSIALMMAKPFFETPSDLPAVGGKPQSAVLVIDDTMSMRRRSSGSTGRTLFSQAKEMAGRLVQMLGGQAELAVIGIVDPSGPLPVLTRESRRVTAAINGMKVGHAHRSISLAVQWAARILSESSLPDRQVFLISDMAAHGWPGKDIALPSGIRFHPLDVAKDLSSDNRAVVALSATGSQAPGQRTTEIVTRVCNYSSRPSGVEVTLRSDEHEVASGRIALEAWACGNKAFQHSFSRGGMHNASVELPPDSLVADNRRHLRLEVEGALRVLLVNGDPSPVRHRDELFYLNTALQTTGPSGQPIATATVTSTDLERVQFTSYDVVVLCNVHTVLRSRQQDLLAFVRGGGGLLVAVGERVEPIAFNRSLAGLLPVELRGALSATPPGTGAPSLRIGRIDRAHPMLRPIWTANGETGLRTARFDKVFRIRPATRSDRRVILWYDDGSPALIESPLGEGRTLLFTSTIDRDWNDLPIRPAYLPLMQQMVRYLGRATMEAPRRSVEVGRTETVPLTKSIRQLHLVDPAGIEHLWAPRDLAGKKAVDIPVMLPGFYKLSAAGTDGVLHVMERQSFMANVNPIESDHRKISPLPKTVRRGSTARAPRRVELWHGLGALLLLLVLVESFLVRRG